MSLSYEEKILRLDVGIQSMGWATRTRQFSKVGNKSRVLWSVQDETELIKAFSEAIAFFDGGEAGRVVEVNHPETHLVPWLKRQLSDEALDRLLEVVGEQRPEVLTEREASQEQRSLLEMAMNVVDINSARSAQNLWRDLPRATKAWLWTRLSPDAKRLLSIAKAERDGLLMPDELNGLLEIIAEIPREYQGIRDTLPENQQKQLWAGLSTEQKKAVEETL